MLTASQRFARNVDRRFSDWGSGRDPVNVEALGPTNERGPCTRWQRGVMKVSSVFYLMSLRLRGGTKPIRNTSTFLDSTGDKARLWRYLAGFESARS